MLLFIAVIVLVFVPDELLFPEPTPTITNTPAPTATPTFPNFLPTPGFETPTPSEPTATNTRVPTASPIPTKLPTPTPGQIFGVLTPVVNPTDTPLPTNTLAPTETVPTNTPIPGRQFSVLFEADKTRLDQGDCATLRWQAQGSITVQLDGQVVPAAGTRRVCPNRNTIYTLTTQLAGSAQIDRRTVSITVNN